MFDLVKETERGARTGRGKEPKKEVDIGNNVERRLGGSERESNKS